jgi:hypothetical protein
VTVRAAQRDGERLRRVVVRAVVEEVHRAVCLAAGLERDALVAARVVLLRMRQCGAVVSGLHGRVRGDPARLGALIRRGEQQVVAPLPGEPVHRSDQHLVTAALLDADRCALARDPARGGRARARLGVTAAVGLLRAALAVPVGRGPTLHGTGGVVAARRLRTAVGAVASGQAQRQRGGDGGQGGGTNPGSTHDQVPCVSCGSPLWRFPRCGHHLSQGR